MNQTVYQKKLISEIHGALDTLKARGVFQPSYVQLETELFERPGFIELISTKVVTTEVDTHGD